MHIFVHWTSYQLTPRCSSRLHRSKDIWYCTCLLSTILTFDQQHSDIDSVIHHQTTSRGRLINTVLMLLLLCRKSPIEIALVNCNPMQIVHAKMLQHYWCLLAEFIAILYCVILSLTLWSRDWPCRKFHVDGECDDGENCRFSHEELTDETRPLLDVVWYVQFRFVEQFRYWWCLTASLRWLIICSWCLCRLLSVTLQKMLLGDEKSTTGNM